MSPSSYTWIAICSFGFGNGICVYSGAGMLGAGLRSLAHTVCEWQESVQIENNWLCMSTSRTWTEQMISGKV